MNLNKLTKAQLIEMIGGLQDELTHIGQKDVCKAEDDSLPWDEQPAAVAQVQSRTTTHAEIMRVRMAVAKAQAMSSGVAVKA